VVTWVTKKDGKIDRIRQTPDEVSPGEEWEKVPNEWGGSSGDKLAWFDDDMRRIPDEDLVERNIRKDNRGAWYNKDTREAKIIHDLDKEPGAGWTKEPPLENEPYQKWDEAAGAWVVDTEAKEEAEKEQRIAEKKSAIQNAEQRIQRSLIAIQAGTATEEDEQYFNRISAEILSLRKELRQISIA
jgi:hypothetical protein